MKKKLEYFTDLSILKRNEKLLAESCYLLSSESVASCTYFETKRDIQRAHKMFDRHLSAVLDVVDYLFTPNGWLLVVTIKSELEILSNINKHGYSSKKMKNAIKEKNISMIISECLRYAISGITRISNRYNRRVGTMVRRNFSRYIFNSVESIVEVMKRMKTEQIKLCCRRKRYRPNMDWYDVKGELRMKGDVFLCSKNHGKASLSVDSKGECLIIIEKTIDVLRALIKATFDYHFANYKSKINSNIVEIIQK